jgi:predicted naringenin-chalcone synthase
MDDMRRDMKKIYLHSFNSYQPLFETSQEQLVEWLIQAHERYNTLLGLPPLNLRLLRRLCLKKEQISKRKHELGEASLDWEKQEVFRLIPDSPRGLKMEDRQAVFLERALRIFRQRYEQKVVPDHLVHVTCTGYLAPGPGQIYFSGKEKTPAFTNAYHMGCYASLPAIRLAAGLLSNNVKRVDILHNEICSLHFDPGNHEVEQMVVQSLFADGHIAYELSLSPTKRSFMLLGIKEKLLPNSQVDMSWIPGSHGMLMTLSRSIPKKIEQNIEEFCRALATEVNLSWEELRAQALFAIHPGGPKIIEAVEQVLDLNQEQTWDSRTVLFERGNMSSATLPHIWERILQREKESDYVVSLAFGPGLTIFGSVFKQVDG